MPDPSARFRAVDAIARDQGLQAWERDAMLFAMMDYGFDEPPAEGEEQPCRADKGEAETDKTILDIWNGIF